MGQGYIWGDAKEEKGEEGRGVAGCADAEGEAERGVELEASGGVPGQGGGEGEEGEVRGRAVCKDMGEAFQGGEGRGARGYQMQNTGEGGDRAGPEGGMGAHNGRGGGGGGGGAGRGGRQGTGFSVREAQKVIFDALQRIECIIR